MFFGRIFVLLYMTYYYILVKGHQNTRHFLLKMHSKNKVKS